MPGREANVPAMDDSVLMNHILDTLACIHKNGRGGAIHIECD